MSIRLDFKHRFPHGIAGIFTPLKTLNTTKSVAREFLDRALLEGRELAEIVTPIGGTSQLVGSIHTKADISVLATIRGRLAWSAPHASVVDQGGPPRTVPIEDLAVWAAEVLGTVEKSDLYAIQGSIKILGTAPQNMELEVTRAWQPIVDRLFEEASREIARRLDK